MERSVDKVVCEYMIPLSTDISRDSSQVFAGCSLTIGLGGCIDTTLDAQNCPRAVARPNSMDITTFRRKKRQLIDAIRTKCGDGPFLHPKFTNVAQVRDHPEKISQGITRMSRMNHLLGE